jgi:AcrR family transcriptional regulator
MGGRRCAARKAPPGNRVRDKTRQKILDAAMQAIKRSGFTGTTVAEIRRRSGASTGSIYHHFGSKERIAATLYAEAMAAYQAVMLAHFAIKQPGKASIEGMVRVHLDWVAANRDLASFVFTTTHPDILSAAKPRLGELNEILFGSLGRFIRSLQDRGELDPDVDIELFIALVIAPAQHFARRWLLGEARNEMSRGRKILARAAWRTVRLKPG